MARSRSVNVRRHRGFSLIEALIAMTILTVALTALAELFALSTKANVDAHATTATSVLAQEKMEQLRALTWGLDANNLPVSDTVTDLTASPINPVGGVGLTPSPPGALCVNFVGYCDFLDARGQSLGGGAVPPANTVFTRRWSIEPLPTNPNNTLVVQVLVTRSLNRGCGANFPNAERLPEEARLVGARTRKAN